MITSADMFLPMLDAEPGFRPTWEKFVREWQDSPEGLPHYLALGDLACHLIRLLEVGQTSRFDAVFEVVERWHVQGDRYVREAATIGLLEDLQNLSLHTSTEPNEFLPWLRPASRRFWEKVEAFWRDGTPITDD
ncbi:MAG: DUF7674 family protein [Pseudomonadota bacterium]